MDCLFCKIINKEIPSKIIYENEAAVAVLDIHPRAPGHTVVLPKHHSPILNELTDEHIGPVFLAVKEVAKKLKNVLNYDGLTIGINQGRQAGQEIDHLHIHLIPRWGDDGGGSIQSIVNNLNKKDISKLWS